jgi:hypothetical protein
VLLGRGATRKSEPRFVEGNMKTLKDTQFYQDLGFSTNPFEGNTAEREPEIELYAVRPPYLDPVEAASFNTGSYTLSGARGSGKSATRITVQRNILKSELPHRLPIALINFTDFRGKKTPEELLNLFSHQVFFLTIETSLLYLTTKSEEEVTRYFASLDKPTKKFVDWSLKNFYLNRPEGARTTSAQECFDLFAISWVRKNKLWADKKWEAITGALVDLTAGITKRFDIDMGDTDSYKNMLAKDKQADVTDPTFILKKAVEFARTMQFTGLLVQVDKVDETDWTSNSAEEAAKLVWPLFSNVQLHEIDGLSWSFFLWDQVRTLMVNENQMPVRWDKLQNDKIKWDNNHLERLGERRLSHFSSEKITKLSQLFHDGTTDEVLYSMLFPISGVAPRTLVTVLNSVLINHIQEVEGKPILMSRDALDRGIDTYTRKTIVDDYTPDTIGQLQRIGSVLFVTKDVAKAFAISSPGARQKIDKWIDLGLVRKIGNLNLGEGAKPVDQFSVIEPRARRIIERQLDLQAG